MFKRVRNMETNPKKARSEVSSTIGISETRSAIKTGMDEETEGAVKEWGERGCDLSEEESRSKSFSTVQPREEKHEARSTKHETRHAVWKIRAFLGNEISRDTGRCHRATKQRPPKRRGDSPGQVGRSGRSENRPADTIFRARYSLVRASPRADHDNVGRGVSRVLTCTEPGDSVTPALRAISLR